MRRLDTLLLLILLLASFNHAMAQMPCTPVAPATWCIAGLVQTSQDVAVTGAINVTAYFETAAAATAVTFDTEIHDSTGALVAQSWQTGVNVPANQMTAAGILVYQVQPTSPIGTYTVRLGVFDSSGAQLLYNTSVATFTVVPQRLLSTAPYPPCYPKFPWVNADYGVVFDSTVTTRFDSWAIWVCDTPGGYVTWSSMGNMANVMPYVLKMKQGTWSVSQAQNDCLSTCVPATASEIDFMMNLALTDAPRAVVAFNGASVTRNVYTVLADGTLNPTPLAGVRVAVASRCDPTIRIPSAPSYYSVAGGNNALGGFVPANSYTICSVALPIGSNK